MSVGVLQFRQNEPRGHQAYGGALDIAFDACHLTGKAHMGRGFQAKLAVQHYG